MARIPPAAAGKKGPAGKERVMAADETAPLAGLRVLDASRVLAGPFCGQLFGDLGAEVLKIERPGAGDETRGWGPPFVPFLTGAGVAELSAYYLSCNRNKRGVALDLSHPEGARLFRELARRCDVVLENFRAASAARLGLSPAELLAVNPRLVVCSISGFGRTGPWADLPGYDFAAQALSGLMSITGPADGEPYKVGVAVTDVLTGLYAAAAVLACLHARQRSGHGYAIDLALLDCAVAAQVNVAQASLSGGADPPRQGNAHLQIVPYQLFATADSWLVLAVGNDGQWRRFCHAAGRPEWADDPCFADNPERVRNRSVLVPMVDSLMRTKKTAEWQDALTAAEVPHAPVWTYADVFACPQAAARGLRVQARDPSGRPVDLVGSPFHIGGAAMPAPTAPPTLGEHTAEVLTGLLGLGAAQLEALRRQGVV
jgi:crotonobetainyl-CoA:carnitine CoA-transferase CaiB-like acyl-CoA transferase